MSLEGREQDRRWSVVSIAFCLSFASLAWSSAPRRHRRGLGGDALYSAAETV
jgi:hypothetical protein